jgi:protein tyrosine phosphatase (PTP) superfamily phosphohydrolase (DUF442 family)
MSDAGHAPLASTVLTVEDGACVRDVVSHASLRDSHVEFISVGGVIASLDSELHDGDELELFIHQPEEPPLPPELQKRSAGSHLEGLIRVGRRGLDRLLEYVPSRLNLSWITNQLAVGGAYQSSDIKLLSRLGITAVVDCRAEDSDDERALQARGIAFLRLPTPDCHDLTQDALERGVVWVGERLARGEKVLVHCQHGVGRGPLLGCCVLVSQGMSPWDALTTIKAHRWQASPNEEQLNALLQFATRHSLGGADEGDPTMGAALQGQGVPRPFPLPLGEAGERSDHG